MGSALVALFWIWVLVAVCYWIYRGYRAIAKRSDQTSTTSKEPKLGSEDDLRTSAPLDLLTGEERGPNPTITPPVPPVPSSVAETAPPAAPVIPAGGSIFDPDGGGSTASSAPIAQQLTGIQMPCDLVPLLDAAQRPGAQETIAFSTTGHAPEEVGRAIGEELRRLDFELEPVTPMHVRATKAGTSLDLEVHPSPEQLSRDGAKVYPYVTAGTVVVEVWR